MKDLDDMKFLKDEAPLLSSIKKGDKPEAPKAYFQSFPDRLMQQVKELPQELPAPNTQGVYRYAAAIAVLVLFSVGTYMFFNRDIKVYQDSIDWATVSQAEIMNEIDVDDIDEDDLIAMIDDEELQRAVATSGDFSYEVEIINESSNILNETPTDSQLDDSFFEGINVNDIDPDLLNEFLEE